MSNLASFAGCNGLAQWRNLDPSLESYQRNAVQTSINRVGRVTNVFSTSVEIQLIHRRNRFASQSAVVSEFVLYRQWRSYGNFSRFKEPGPPTVRGLRPTVSLSQDKL